MKGWRQWLALWLSLGLYLGVSVPLVLLMNEEDQTSDSNTFLWLMLGWVLLVGWIPMVLVARRAARKSAATTDAPPQSPQPARSSRDDSDFYTTKKQDDHQWYGEHHELNWRDREYGQAMGWDVDAYVNWLEQD